jgi:2-methylcitrate dehydratase PrpD
MTLPAISVSQHLAKAFSGMPAMLPAEVTQVWDAILVDVAGLCVAACRSDYVQATLRATSDPGACTLIGHPGSHSVATATLVNGTAAQGEDYDDTFRGRANPCGGGDRSALLATAEHHGLTGGDFARGVAVGCEVMCRLCLVAPKRVHIAGFHPTAVFGALGAAAGVSSALRLDTGQWCNALGIAGSMASGIIEYLAEGCLDQAHASGLGGAGGISRRAHGAGWLHRPANAVRGEHGFFHAFANSDRCDFSAMLDGAGVVWLAADIAFKPYACGTMAHPYIDCARKLVAEGVSPEDVIAIECKTAEGIVHRLWEPLAAKQHPPNGYAAKFSIPYAMPSAMLRGDAGLDEYGEAVVHDRAIRALASKVSYVVDPDNPYPRQFTGHVRVTLSSGEVREAVQGHFPRRTGRTDVSRGPRGKFMANCAYGGWNEARARSALAALGRMRAAPKVILDELRE